MQRDRHKWCFAVDRGGTFTDVIGRSPQGTLVTEKLLSVSPRYADASIEGIRRILDLPRDRPLPEERIGVIRFGTTVATNALLERKGGPAALLITRGFADLLEIGDQTRPSLFDPVVRRPPPLYSLVEEVPERIDARGRVLEPLDSAAVAAAAERIAAAGVEAAAVVLLHAYRNPAHEIACGRILARAGVPRVYLSHRTMNLIKAVPRGQSTLVDAYLSPVLARYLDSIRSQTRAIPIEFMQGHGGLAPPRAFRGKEALLSGPAGGAVAAAHVARRRGFRSVVALDMGGTSTDVSRWHGDFERVYERTVAGVTVQSEMLDIQTVAAGGGSVLRFEQGRLRVGPDSAGARPGPACYGLGGPLCVTDANLLTGRIVASWFPRTLGPGEDAGLDPEPVRRGFARLAREIGRAAGREVSPEGAALGFLEVANQKMALAIKEISVAKGYDVREDVLVCFGGAAGQHACGLASILGIRRLLFHPLSSLFSAYGIGLTHPAAKAAATVLGPLTPETHARARRRFAELEEEAAAALGRPAGLVFRREVDLRPLGADAWLTLEDRPYADLLAAFREEYRRRLGVDPQDRPVELVHLRVEARLREPLFGETEPAAPAATARLRSEGMQEIITPHGPAAAPIYRRDRLPPGARLGGPCLVVDPYTTVVIEPGYTAEHLGGGLLEARPDASAAGTVPAAAAGPDPALLEIFHHLFMNIADEMGHILRQAAHSVNIKERRDFSCAVFDAAGGLVANAPHIPVHLGAMADTVRSVAGEHRGRMRPGDVYLTNDPYRGGSHLPDMTAVAPVFSDSGEPLFFTAVRAHHADVGGVVPGSMPARARRIQDEGVLVRDFLLVRDGVFAEAALERLLTDPPHPVRNLPERIADLKAMVAACRKGEAELGGLVERFGADRVRAYMGYIQANAAAAVREALCGFLAGRGEARFSGSDTLDDGTPLAVSILIRGGEDPPRTVSCVVDFTGTGAEHTDDNLNAPLAVTGAAVLYVLRSVTGREIPLNGGCLEPVEIVAPAGCLLNPRPPCAVASGNVETSQRIVDLLLGALGVAADSQGTMNNLLFQLEGETPYYETLGGGAGATARAAGASGVQVHMTNTRITDPEVLEQRHGGVRLLGFRLRRGSGGAGALPGGDGLVREILFTKAGTVTMISERRVKGPRGLAGGSPGLPGRNVWIHRDGRTEILPGRFTRRVHAGDVLRVLTPGGGGYGRADDHA